MTSLKFSFSPSAPAFKKDLVFVLGVHEPSNSLQLTKGTVDTSSLAKQQLEQLDVSAKFESITKIAAPNSAVFALIGLGKESKKLTTDNYRELGGAIARSLKLFTEAVIDLGKLDKVQTQALIEGIQLGNYEFFGKKSANSIKASKLAKLVIVSAQKFSATELRQIEALTEAVNQTKNLVNLPPNEIYPASFVKQVTAAVKNLPVKVTVWDEKALAKDGFGGILAVGMGSSRPPRLVKIVYQPKGAKKHLALVGKGITFDTGGLSLKPAESMVGMKYDMTGAATCFQSVLAIAKLGLPIKVTGWLCLAENMPSGTAQRPDDVIRIRNGKTVEVLNTDAEGRLVLADGLSAAAEDKPDLIVDVATLTGAATIALGNRYAGLMGESSAVNDLDTAAKLAGELLWPMPLPEELRTILNSDVADIANVKIGNRAGGMLVGGQFLREFVPLEIPWAHLDIAGPAANAGSAYGYTPKGATGVMVRTLVMAAKSMSSNK
jgi:leucyl aminopeptidase